MPRLPFSRIASLAILPAALLAPACSAGGGGEGSGGSTSSSGEGGSGGATSSAGGTSGSTASVGSASSAASGAGGAGGGAALGCADLPLCDDFEGAAEGGPPDAAKWMVVSPSCSGSGSLAIDAGQAHSGAKSLKVAGGGTYCDHIFIANTAAIAAIGASGVPVYGRFFVRFSDPLGDNHTTFMTMKDSADNNKDLRMGGQSKILMWNRESDDATLPSLSPAGIAKSTAPAAQKWLCIEFMVDEANSLIQTWVDGAEIEGLRVDGAPTSDIDQQWLNKAGWKPSLTDFKLGWESYAGQSLTLWFDDVALAGQRVGCE